jgi:hypothetical protein
VPDAMMYREDYFVVLEANREEEFVSREELIAKLQQILATNLDNLPRELTKIAGIEAQAAYLADNYYEFDLGEGNYLQWYVTRLEK